MSNRILIVSQSHLCRNPRVLKESLALSKAGYSVSILTAIHDDESLRQDLELIRDTPINYFFYSDLRVNNIGAFTSRLIRKLAVVLQTEFKKESVFSLGYNAVRLKKMCLAHDADLYIMHQELATAIGSQMVNNYRVAFDIEDWYSEDLLQTARAARPIQLLRKAEKIAIENSACCYTTSYAMAQGLQAAYQANKLPAVIYNSFSALNSIKLSLHQTGPLKLYWFSQTIGHGRGLEFFISCMAKSAFSWELTLRGNIIAGYGEQLNSLMNLKDSLIILQPLKSNELLNDMANYDLGLALEPSAPPNKDLTISNKFFHYMAAGLPVIASATAGHSEIGLKNEDIVFLYEQNNIQALIDILNTIGQINFKANLSMLKGKVLESYKANYSWHIEEKKLVDLIKGTIGNNSLSNNRV